MRNKHTSIKHLLVALLMFFMFMCSTAVPDEPFVTTLSPESRTPLKATLSSTPQPNSLSTPTSISESRPITTASPTVSPTPSVTAPSPTPTWIPTLDVAEKEAYLLDTIITNNGCDLPCFWGIYPGQSTWERVRKVLGFLFPLPPESLSFETSSYVNQISIPNIHLSLSVSKDVVQRVTMLAENSYPPGHAFHFPAFEDALQAYSIDSVLAQNGVPSRVLLFLRSGIAEPGGSWHYNIWLFYDNLGILVFYQFDAGISLDPQTEILLVCPNQDAPSLLGLYLRAPDNVYPLETIAGIQGSIDSGLYKTLEETTDLSREDFYNLFVEVDGVDCFESPVSGW